ncbi:MAG: lmo0937 family membrane protein [Clostridiales bacterium]|nr:lmo0937 family membrane protein [Clostridiales bacterium]
MLWTIAAILLLLWVVGLITSTTFGGFVHVLVVIALILVIVQLLRRSRSK